MCGYPVKCSSFGQVWWQYLSGLPRQLDLSHHAPLALTMGSSNLSGRGVWFTAAISQHEEPR